MVFVKCLDYLALERHLGCGTSVKQPQKPATRSSESPEATVWGLALELWKQQNA